MGLLSNILIGLGFSVDAIENIRPTTTDVKDNKPKDRKYDFDDGTGYTSEDYLRERRKRQRERKNKPKAPKNKTTDESVR